MSARVAAIRKAAAAGRIAEALRDAAALCAERPADVEAARLRAMLSTHAGAAEAPAAWQRVLALVPDDAEAHFQLGNAAGDRGDFAAAVAHLEAARARMPRHALLLNNLGLALEAQGNLPAAIERFDEAMASDARAAQAIRPSFARVLFRAGRYAQALTQIDRLAAGGHPLDPQWLAARAACLAELGRDTDALAAYRAAVAGDARAASVWHDFVRWLLARHRFDDAHEVLVAAHAALPDDAMVLSLLVSSQQRAGDWDGLPALRARLVARVADPEWNGVASGYDFTAIVDDPALQRRVAERYAAGATATALPDAPRGAVADAARRLCIGFVSSDYRDHPVGRLVVPLIERLDRTRFEIVAYTTGPADDVTGGRIAAAGAGPRALPRRDPAAAAQRLRSDSVDILIDLNGFSGGEALRIFALRPAPLQVNFLGYTGTLGSAAYDRIVTDRYCIPADACPHYVERPLYVEPCYLPSDPMRPVGDAPTRAGYGLPEEAVVMYAGSASYKVTPEMFAAWMDVLRDVPRAVLWLRAAPDPAVDRLRAAAAARGIATQRLVFAPAEPIARYLARFALADLFLDTHPFGAHTTVNDALFMGVPVVTLAGRSFAARASASQVVAAGHSSLVAADLAAYGAIARSLAGDAARRGEARASLRDVRAAPLFDADRYAAAFCEALLDAARGR